MSPHPNSWATGSIASHLSCVSSLGTSRRIPLYWINKQSTISKRIQSNTLISIIYFTSALMREVSSPRRVGPHYFICLAHGTSKTQDQGFSNLVPDQHRQTRIFVLKNTVFVRLLPCCSRVFYLKTPKPTTSNTHFCKEKCGWCAVLPVIPGFSSQDTGQRFVRT